MGCCDDPTEPQKLDPRELVRMQEQYGNLVRDLFTDDPEKVILKQLHDASRYLRELAALRAHYPSVRLQAIELLDGESLSILKRIVDQDSGSDFADAASKRISMFN